MKRPLSLLVLLACLSGAITFTGYARPQETVRFAGTTCDATPYLHCPDKDCVGDRVINEGNVVEMKKRRTYFPDYPCDLKKGEKVTFILSLHGAGSYGNWQRHYFPIMDYKDKYRLVIATPNSPTRVWSDADDEYLHNIVDSIIAQLGRENIKAFWLVGHSQGGLTSNRIVRTDYFKDKVDGWLSLSGGRLGGNPGRAATFGPPRTATAPGAAPGTNSTAPTASAISAAMAALRGPPATDFSFRSDEPRRLVLLALRQLQARLLELIQQRRQLRRSALQWRRCGSLLRRIFLSSIQPASVRWMKRDFLIHRRGRLSTRAGNEASRPRSQTPKPATFSTARVRILRTPRGVSCPGPAKLSNMFIRIAKTGGSSPTWFE